MEDLLLILVQIRSFLPQSKKKVLKSSKVFSFKLNLTSVGHHEKTNYKEKKRIAGWRITVMEHFD